MNVLAPRTLGSSDLVVSGIGIGCNNFSRPGSATESQEASTRVIHAAIDAGITLFDGADLYGAEPGLSETYMGVALQGGWRDKMVLATKFGHSKSPGVDGELGPRGGERFIRHSVEESLRRLQTDRIDLYQMHEPDPTVPIEETLGVLHELVVEGKVVAIGNSNFSREQLLEADAAAARLGVTRFISAQNEFSLLKRDVEADVLPAAFERGIGFLPFFPLYNGILTGKYTREGGGEGRVTRQKPQLLAGVDWDRMEAYQAICDSLGAPMVQVSIAWLLGQPGVSSVIAGATGPEQVTENAGAAELELSASTLREISELFS